jgi:hypothetical protein
LAPANIAITSVTTVDVNSQPEPTVVTGQKIYVRVDWTITGSDGHAHGIQCTVDGIPIPSGVVFATVPGSHSDVFGGWYVGPGLHIVRADADYSNNVAESNESDNTMFLGVTPQTPASPEKLAQFDRDADAGVSAGGDIQIYYSAIERCAHLAVGEIQFSLFNRCDRAGPLRE